ncbi:family 16 glycosylhydrolase [uncultured Polaribacter sp.]|uniref:family 16 glycosylhydrolase n=1 Tax=uncultured Polaribacter sp. TaxID=174711 RepID=UPI002618F820|nr:family 16 glycosylhydrolase [uncultured Polaribacter sp.]
MLLILKIKYASFILIIFNCFFLTATAYAQKLQDNFEGNGNITTWYKDDCTLDLNVTNPYKESLNISNTVLKYNDIGGKYANIGFNKSTNFDLSVYHTFQLKIFIPSNSLSGSQTNQIFLKLQNGTLQQPWTTQSEIKKTLLLNQWQDVTFDFKNDSYINLDSNSLPPIERNDFNRVVIQVNGENNTDLVIAYMDDFLYDDVASENTNPVFDTLVWSDEFDGNGAIDATKWHHQTKLIAGDSWANNEQQHYTTRQENSYVNNGSLKIKAIKETYSDQGHQKEYTSGRLNSKFAFKYGRVEVRAKLPSVAGSWPAIWLLGKNINEDGAYWDNLGYGTTNWPWCGEIDMMEPNITKTEILATWHWNNGEGYTYFSKGIATNNTDTSQNFHIYSLEWNSNFMKIYMDGTLINQMETINPFNQDYFILLNLAMGGNLGGTIDANFTEDIMEIDYIRVYQESALSVDKISTNQKVFIYPNPVKDFISIALDTDVTIKNVQIFDITGKRIREGNHAKMSLKNLKKGMYLVKIITSDGVIINKKIIKE